MNDGIASRRIASFCAGAGLTALCGFLAWISFALLTAMMNPALAGADFWAAVRDRAVENPEVIAFLALCCAGTVLGLCLTVRSLAWPRRKPAAPGTLGLPK